MDKSFTVSENFLKEEVREGFLVPEMMKRAWASQLKTLTVVDRVCKKHNINYFAIYGTLLGAVRHKGFIPWDDDIDIGMSRADYMKFMEVCEEMGEPFRVKSIYTDRPFSQFHGVICNATEEKLTYNKERIRDFFGCPYIIGIDIVQYDFVPRDSNTAKLQELMYYLGYSLSMDYENKGVNEDYLNTLAQFNARMGTSLNVNAPNFITELRRITDRISMFCNEEDADLVCYYPQNAYLGRSTKLKKEWIKGFVEMEFENIKIPVPKAYDNILRALYGENYMTPVNQSAAHDYPFYKTQEEYFKFTGDM